MLRFGVKDDMVDIVVVVEKFSFIIGCGVESWGSL